MADAWTKRRLVVQSARQLGKLAATGTLYVLQGYFIMSTKSLSTLKKLTKPKSKQEINSLLIARHGSTIRENVSADSTALDKHARQTIPSQRKKNPRPV